jgi:hypothetical protein
VPRERDRTLGVGWRPLTVAALVWAAKCALIIRFPLRKLAMCCWVLDDTFIFMRISRNLALGRGYSFDGVEPTAGAPPLWIWLTSLNHLALGPDEAVKLALAESALFGSLAAILVYEIAARAFERRVAWVSFVLVLFLAPLVCNSMNGMDTSIFAFLSLLAIALYARTDRAAAGAGRFFLLGGVLGLANLARSDGIFITAAVLAIEVYVLLRLGPLNRRVHARRVAALVVGIALFTSPLIFHSLAASGSLFPANQVGRRALAWEWALGSDGCVVWSRYLPRVAFKFMELQSLVAMSLGSALVGALALVTGLRHRGGRRIALVTGIFLSLYFGALIFYQWYFPDVHGLRYVYLPAHLMSIFIAALICRLAFAPKGDTAQSVVGGWAVVAGAVLLLLSASAFSYRDMVKSGFPDRKFLPTYSQDEEARWWALIDWMSAELPPGALVAATDHGRLSYFTTAQIVDLDGILYPAIVEHIRQGTVDSYIRDKGAEYIVLQGEDRGRLSHKLARRELAATPVEEVEGAPHSFYRILR